MVANWGKTRPGQSQRTMESERWIVWKCLVFPGVDETLTFFSPRREFIVLDLPTLGYPTRPTFNFVGGLPVASEKSTAY